MESKIVVDLHRRRMERVNFYRSAIGNKLKKRRIEMKMTQETLGKGIISNTFVSKLENNAIHANKECLMLLMERLDLPPETSELPEEMLEFLDRSLECFYWADRTGYQNLFDELQKFEYAILIQIARLGYHVLNRHMDEASKIQGDLLRYLPSMETNAFATFMIFGAALFLQVNDFDRASQNLSAAAEVLPGDRRLMGLLRYFESVLYGKTQNYMAYASSSAEARRIFGEDGNFSRMMIMVVDGYEFRLGENAEWVLPYREEHLKMLDAFDRDRYHLVRGFQEASPFVFLDKIGTESPIYAKSLFIRCSIWKSAGSESEYQKTKELLRNHQAHHSESIDYFHLLNLQEKNDQAEYKEYLIDNILPLGNRWNDIFLLRMATREITRILADKKRYKDACSYNEKMNRDIERIKTIKKLKHEASVD
jgi:transcriptional regulator with XRE-family HTH domain